MSKKSKISKSSGGTDDKGTMRRRTRMIALEPRMLFDGALGIDLATKATAVVSADSSHSSSAPPDNLAPASPAQDRSGATPAAPKDSSTAVVAAAQTAQSASATPAEKDALQKPGAEALDAVSKSAAPKELVFVDSRVKDYQSQLAGVDSNATIVFLDASKDGVTQIADTMANTSGITAVHIIAEGSAEQLLPGSATPRSALEIATAMDAVGGEMNAFTAKEHTCYYANVLASDLPLAVTLLSDLVTEACNTAEDLESERTVVLEEIAMRDDEPSDAVHDLFAETLFGDTPVGRSVLGSVESIENLTRDDVHGWYRRRYTMPNIVVTAAGRVEHQL